MAEPNPGPAKMGRLTAASSGARSAIRFVAWAFPAALLLAGYITGMFLPEFAGDVPWPAPGPVWPPLMVTTLVAVGWLLFEMKSAVDRETTVGELQADHTVSVTWAFLFAGGCGWFIATKGTMPWWFLVPFVESILDGILTGYLGINNAAQKPFFGKRGTE